MEVIQITDEQSDMLSESIQQKSNETIPPKHRIAKNKLLTGEILKIKDEKKLIKAKIDCMGNGRQRKEGEEET